ncbi:MAG: hypothetical protein ACFFD2_15620 [Promethearchaeota archaeon]
MPKKKNVKKQLKKALEDIITTESAIVTFLRNEFGDESVRKFYTNYRPKFILELQLGFIRRTLAKMAAKIAKKMLLKMIINTFLEKGEWYQPPETIEIKKLTKEEAALRIFPCNRKKMFKKIIKKKDKSVEPTYICNVMCIPEITYYLTFIGLIPKFELEKKGCQVKATWNYTKIQFEEDMETD